MEYKCRNVIELYEKKNNFDCTNELQQILNKTEYDIGLLIIWDEHYKDIILKELNNYNISVFYNKIYNTTNKFTENLLRQIHYNKIWWEKNIIQETNKRFKNNINCYFIIKKFLHTEVRILKNDIRNKYKLDKCVFHMSDPDCRNHIGIKCNCHCNRDEFNNETYKHIQLLMNKNTLHFLYNSNYLSNLNFYKYFNTYYNYIHLNNLNHNEYLIDNGGVMSLYGLRDAHDLDYITTNNIQFKNKDNDCMNYLHEKEFEKLNLSIKDIINNPENHFYFNGMKVLSIYILKNFKYNRTQNFISGRNTIRIKDINDYNTLLKFLNT